MNGSVTLFFRCENRRCNAVHRILLSRATAARLSGADALRLALAQELDARDRARDSELIPLDGMYVCSCGWKQHLNL